MQLIWVLFGAVFWAAFSCLAYAQHPYFWQLTTEHGLPSNTVYDLFQDSRGYIWMGTEQGLTCYNGRTFRKITAPEAQSPSATFICEHPDGSIWFLNFAGQFFQVRGDTAHLSPLWVQMGKPAITTLLCDKLGHIWLCSEFDIIQVLPEHNRFAKRIYVSRDTIYPHLEVFAVLENGGLLFVSRDGTYELKSDTNIAPIKIGNANIGNAHTGHFAKASAMFPGPQFISTVMDWSATMEVNGWAQVTSVDGELVNNYPINNLSGKLLAITRDRDGEHWFCTTNGTAPVRLPNSFISIRGILFPEKSVSSILRDAEGNYWVSTLREGVYVMPSLNMQCFNQRNSNLPDSRINCLSQDGNGRLLLGMVGGRQIAIFDPQQQKVVGRYDVGNNAEVEAIYYWKERDRIIGGGYVFENGRPNPLYRFDIMLGVKAFAKLGNSLLFASGVMLSGHTLEPQIGTALPLSDALRSRYIVVGKQPYDPPEANPFAVYHRLQFRRHRTRSVCTNPASGAIYGGYADRLVRYSDANEVTIADPATGAAIIAWDMALDARGILWVATTNRGIYWVQGDSVIRHISQADGLLSNACKTLFVDSARGVWVGSDKGINLISFEGQVLKSFNSLDGLATNEINDIEVLGGHVWAATSVGLLTFPADFEPHNRHAPNVYFPRIQLMDQDTAFAAPPELAYDENTVTVFLEGIAFRSRGSFYYQYRLVGQDTNWVRIPSGQDFVRFSGLSPGDYRLEVVAVNEDGTPSAQPATFVFTIQPPFWQRWWFVALVFAVLGSATWYLVRRQLARIRKQSEVQQQLRSSQLQALRAQMNPHFIFNALNSIQEFILLSDKLQANSFLGKFADLMRLYLDASATQETPIEDEITATELYLELEQLRMDGNLDFSIEFAPGTPREGYSIPAMIIQPFIENAVKHGLLHKESGRGELHIRLSMPNGPDRLRCEITDNGIGRAESARINAGRSAKHKSFAVKAATRRLELLNATQQAAIGLLIEDLYHPGGQAAGTRVVLDMPVVYPPAPSEPTNQPAT